MMTQFAGFNEEAFAIYAPQKWSSMVHNLPRMRNKDALLALCDQAVLPLQDRLFGLVRAASDEIPNITNQKKVDAQWVYWFRDTASRQSLNSFLSKTPLDENVIFHIAPQDKHATLSVIMRQQELFLGLRVAPGAVVDRRNLQQKLRQGWEREALCEQLAALPGGATIGFADAQKAAHQVGAAALAEFSDSLVAQAPTFVVGHVLPSPQAIALGAQLRDYITHWLGALLPIYRFVAWTRENDLIDVGKRLQEEKAQKRRQSTAYSCGDRVRFIGGLFAGKTGVVAEVDGKAQVRVQVGKMTVTVSGTDLAPSS